jgi:hypothetical protein
MAKTMRVPMLPKCASWHSRLGFLWVYLNVELRYEATTARGRGALVAAALTSTGPADRHWSWSRSAAAARATRESDVERRRARGFPGGEKTTSRAT